MINVLFSGRKNADNSSYYKALVHFGCKVIEAGNNSIGYADALLLGGGGDISPKFYNYRGSIEKISIEDEKRDAMEFELIKEFMARDRPILGICRGAQILAVSLGGTLVEDIASWKENFAPVKIRHNGHIHVVETVPDSFMGKVLGRRTMVNSFHHQAIHQCGKMSVVSARAPDGICEAIEHKDAKILGVQWHPEKLENEASYRLFESFCNAAGSKF